MANTRVVRTQQELDGLPDKFEAYTVIEIRGTETIVISKLWENSRAVLRGNSRAELRENSRAELRDNSTAELWDNSRAELRENSTADAFLCATLIIYSALAVVGKLLDNSNLVYKSKGCKRPEDRDASAKITEFEELITPTFEQWLERGYVVADGIHQKLVSEKKVGKATIFETTDLLGVEKFFVAKSGNKFSHGKTIKEAKDDLRYKISDRDTTEFKKWTIKTIATKEKMIEAYRKITGACAEGVKDFVAGKNIAKKLSVSEVVALTKNSYGHDAFRQFFKGGAGE